MPNKDDRLENAETGGFRAVGALTLAVRSSGAARVLRADAPARSFLGWRSPAPTDAARAMRRMLNRCERLRVRRALAAAERTGEPTALSLKVMPIESSAAKSVLVVLQPCAAQELGPRESVWTALLFAAPTGLASTAAEESRVALLEDAFDTLPFGVLIYDANDVCLFVNASLRNVHDWLGPMVERRATFQEIDERIRRAYVARGLEATADYERFVAARREPNGAELLQRRPDGGYVLRRAQPIGDGAVFAMAFYLSSAPDDAMVPNVARYERRMFEMERELRRKIEGRNSALISAKAALRVAAELDPLTDLANRRGFERAYRGEQADGAALHVLLIDLDHFKRINDTLGHDAGDHVIQETARRLTAFAEGGADLPAGAFILPARFGGDEFALLIRAAAPTETIDAAAQRLCAALAQPIRFQEANSSVTASIGVAAVVADDATLSASLRKADLALYDAKRRGRGCASRFCPEMAQEAEALLNMSAAVRGALGSSAAQLRFRPRLALNGGAVRQYAGALDWTAPQDPPHGLAKGQPSDLASVAAAAGLCGQLREQALRGVLAAAQSLPDGAAPVSAALSSAELSAPGGLDAVRAADLPPGRFVVALTDPGASSACKTSVWALDALREMGVRIEAQGFGGAAPFDAILALRPDAMTLEVRLTKVAVSPEGAAARTAQRFITNAVHLAGDLGIGLAAVDVDSPELRDALCAFGVATQEGSAIAAPILRLPAAA